MTTSETAISLSKIREGNKMYPTPDTVARAKEASEFYSGSEAGRRSDLKAAKIKRIQRRVEELKTELRSFPGSNADAKARDAAWLSMSPGDFPIAEVSDILKRRRYNARARAEKAHTPKPPLKRVIDPRIKKFARKLEEWASAGERRHDTWCLLMRISKWFDDYAKSYVQLLDLREQLGRNPSYHEYAAFIHKPKPWANDRMVKLRVFEEAGAFADIG